MNDFIAADKCYLTPDGTLHVIGPFAPKRVKVSLPDLRGREVYTARVYAFEPERGECHVECFDDGLDEALDGSVIYLGAKWYLSCGHEVEGSERPNFCSTCGAKLVNA